MRWYNGYMIFSFYWETAEPESINEAGAYYYAFDVNTGKLSNDEGLLEEMMGEEIPDVRYVTAIAPIGHIAAMEWEGIQTDVIEEDMEEIGKMLAKQAAPKLTLGELVMGARVPEHGEIVVVWQYTGGMTESTPNGPGEYECEYSLLGELDELIIKRKET